MSSEFTNFILEFMYKKCEFTQHRSASLILTIPWLGVDVLDCG
jgi:hypothetical protein